MRNKQKSGRKAQNQFNTINQSIDQYNFVWGLHVKVELFLGIEHGGEILGPFHDFLGRGDILTDPRPRFRIFRVPRNHIPGCGWGSIQLAKNGADDFRFPRGISDAVHSSSSALTAVQYSGRTSGPIVRWHAFPGRGDRCVELYVGCRTSVVGFFGGNDTGGFGVKTGTSGTWGDQRGDEEIPRCRTKDQNHDEQGTAYCIVRKKIKKSTVLSERPNWRFVQQMSQKNEIQPENRIRQNQNQNNQSRKEALKNEIFLEMNQDSVIYVEHFQFK